MAKSELQNKPLPLLSSENLPQNMVVLVQMLIPFL
jgi:hypothetical protein